jgi:hypothetical protein
MTFVNAVLDAVIVIAGGGAGGVPGLIETALVTAIPVLIGFLAALLGIGGLADKVKKLFQSLSKPVMKAVDWIVGKIATFGKKLWGKMKAGAAKLKDKFVRKKDQHAAGAAGPEHERRAIADAERILSTKPTREHVESRLPGISRRHGVPLRLVTEPKHAGDEYVHVQTMSTDSHDLAEETDPELQKLEAVLGKPTVEALRTELGNAEVIALVKAIGPYGVQKLADGLAPSVVKSLLAQLDAALLSKVFKGRQPATGTEFKKLIDQFGAADIVLLAQDLGGKLAQILRWDMFSLDPAQEQRLAAGHGQTAKTLPPLEGKLVADVRAILIGRGMTLAASAADHEMYTHTDHSVVRLKTGPLAFGPYTPFPHAVMEVTKTTGDVGKEAVYGKFAEGGQVIPKGINQAEDQLKQWFASKAGKRPSQAQVDAMMDMWGKVGHVRLR